MAISFPVHIASVAWQCSYPIDTPMSSPWARDLDSDSIREVFHGDAAALLEGRLRPTALSIKP